MKEALGDSDDDDDDEHPIAWAKDTQTGASPAPAKVEEEPVNEAAANEAGAVCSGGQCGTKHSCSVM
jgi:hypothetical protein